jgi:hypothetical protein
VLRTKMLLEAGFLAEALGEAGAARIISAAGRLLAAHDEKDAAATARHTKTLAGACTTGWRAHWKRLGG